MKKFTMQCLACQSQVFLACMVGAQESRRHCLDAGGLGAGANMFKFPVRLLKSASATPPAHSPRESVR